MISGPPYRLYRDFRLGSNLENLREYVHFAYENEMRTDPIYISYELFKNALQGGIIRFTDISQEANDFLSRRKLWDFMEDIPLSEDPRRCCKRIIQELMDKVMPGN